MGGTSSLQSKAIHKQRHIHVYMYMYICVCVFVNDMKNNVCITSSYLQTYVYGRYVHDCHMWSVVQAWGLKQQLPKPTARLLIFGHDKSGREKAKGIALAKIDERYRTDGYIQI